MEMVVIVQMKLQSRLGYLIMKNWWWTKTQLPKKPFIRSVLELSYLFDWFSPYELIGEAQNINLRAITAFGSTSRRLQVSLSIRHLHRNLLLNVIIHLTFLVIGGNHIVGSKGHQQKISWIVPSCFGRTSIQEKNHNSKWWLSILSLVSLSLSYSLYDIEHKFCYHKVNL